MNKNISNLLNVTNLSALTFLLLTILTAGHYGYFCDELYFIDCSKNLDFGYVDHPPLVAVIAFICIKIFGETLIGLRFFSGLMGAGTILLSSSIAKSLGSNKFAQSLTALLILFSAGFPAMSSYFSMNSIDIFLSTLFFLVIIKIVDNPSPKNWILLGLILGVGMLNKYTFLVLGFSLLVALIVTKHWRYFISPWLYISGSFAILLFLPHILWQINHDWPTIEFMKNAIQIKHLSLSPWAFLLQLILGLNPFTFPIWISGLIFLLIGKCTKKYHVLGWVALIFLLVYITQKSKAYYVLPIFPLFFASGTTLIELFIRKFNLAWLKGTIITIVIVSGTILMPIFIPLLPVQQFISYSKIIGIWDHIKLEKNESDMLPLHFVYRFGWIEITECVAKTYHSLPEDEKTNCAILASWYGPAGAINHFGKQYHLPQAISGRNNYWIWGTHGHSGEILISVGFDKNHMKQYYNEVIETTPFNHPYAYDLSICICRNPKYQLNDIWSKFKTYH